MREVPTPAPPVLTGLLELDALVEVRGLQGPSVRLTTKGVVGSAVAGGVRVTVEPRHLSRASLLGMLADDPSLVLARTSALHDPDPDLFRVLARAFCESCDRLFRRGLRRTYTDRTARLDVLRGEPLLERWHGPRSPEGPVPVCRFRERDLDLPEHRVLRRALRLLARAEALDLPIRRRAAGLERTLADVPPDPNRSEPLRVTGLFAPYAEPIALARALLLGLSEDDGPAEGRAFLVDVDKLLERWLVRMLRESLPSGWTVAAQLPLSFAKPALTRFLDAVLLDPEGRVAVILDAKNKAMDDGRPGRDDLHQLVSYLAVTRCRRGVLVGLHGGEALATRTWTLDGGVGTVTVARLPARGDVLAMRGALMSLVPALLTA
ncbi:MAG: 5-methylcytosine restriction system specificity protein McrC [Myxococcota bacterium]